LYENYVRGMVAADLTNAQIYRARQKVSPKDFC